MNEKINGVYCPCCEQKSGFSYCGPFEYKEIKLILYTCDGCGSTRSSKSIYEYNTNKKEE